MSTCGAQDCNTNPRPLFLSKNPSGRISLISVPVDELYRKDYRKWCPLRWRPSAVSFNCGTEKAPRLPKHKKTTDEWDVGRAIPSIGLSLGPATFRRERAEVSQDRLVEWDDGGADIHHWQSVMIISKNSRMRKVIDAS
ncbi:hypothetical protein AAC387_Pa02g3265 [Persea americana]